MRTEVDSKICILFRQGAKTMRPIYLWGVVDATGIDYTARCFSSFSFFLISVPKTKASFPDFIVCEPSGRPNSIRAHTGSHARVSNLLSCRGRP